MRTSRGKPLMCSMDASYHFLHDLAAFRLQWPHPASRQEPHTFIFIAAVNNVDAVAGDCVMECAAGVLGNESEESFPPWIISVDENLFAQLREFFIAHRSNGFGDRFAPLLVEVLKIKFFEWHGIEFSPLNIVRQGMKEIWMSGNYPSQSIGL